VKLTRRRSGGRKEVRDLGKEKIFLFLKVKHVGTEKEREVTRRRVFIIKTNRIKRKILSLDKE
jgi:hypothetical protein